MFDVGQLWTTTVVGCGIQSCTFHKPGCTDSYTGNKLEFDKIGGKSWIIATQNVEAGWSETGCIKCKDSGAVELTKDGLTFTQRKKAEPTKVQTN